MLPELSFIELSFTILPEISFIELSLEAASISSSNTKPIPSVSGSSTCSSTYDDLDLIAVL
jgi:hypothetical protein